MVEQILAHAATAAITLVLAAWVLPKFRAKDLGHTIEEVMVSRWESLRLELEEERRERRELEAMTTKARVAYNEIADVLADTRREMTALQERVIVLEQENGHYRAELATAKEQLAEAYQELAVIKSNSDRRQL